MSNDKVVVLTREVVDEILSELCEHTERYDLTGKIREQMNRKDESLFNSPTFAEEPLTLATLKKVVSQYISSRQFTFVDFEFMANNGYDESGPWVKTFWDTGAYFEGSENAYRYPSSSGTFWDQESQTGIFYLQLTQHEIVFNLDLSVIKVRKDCSLLNEVQPWTEWTDETNWLSSSVGDLERVIEDWF